MKLFYFKGSRSLGTSNHFKELPLFFLTSFRVFSPDLFTDQKIYKSALSFRNIENTKNNFDMFILPVINGLLKNIFQNIIFENIHLGHCIGYIPRTITIEGNSTITRVSQSRTQNLQTEKNNNIQQRSIWHQSLKGKKFMTQHLLLLTLHLIGTIRH